MNMYIFFSTVQKLKKGKNLKSQTEAAITLNPFLIKQKQCNFRN